MDDDEMEEILYRLDERTKRVDNTLDRLDNKVRQNEGEIAKIQKQTNKNSQYISVAGKVFGFLSASLAALIAKVAGVLGP